MDDERILSVEHVVDEIHDRGDLFDGYKITTTRQTIRVLVSSGCYCCENSGTAWLHPRDTDVTGARVLSVGWGRKVDESLQVESLDDAPAHWEEEEEAPRRGRRGNVKELNYAVVDIRTDAGLVQMVGFNEHNGFYPHSVFVSWDGHEEVQEL